MEHRMNQRAVILLVASLMLAGCHSETPSASGKAPSSVTGADLNPRLGAAQKARMLKSKNEQ